VIAAALFWASIRRTLHSGAHGISDFPLVAGRHRRGALHDTTTARCTGSRFARCRPAQPVAPDLGMHPGSLGICRRHLDRDLLVFVTPTLRAERSRSCTAHDFRKKPRPVLPAEAHPIVRMHRMSLMRRRLRVWTNVSGPALTFVNLTLAGPR